MSAAVALVWGYGEREGEVKAAKSLLMRGSLTTDSISGCLLIARDVGGARESRN